MDPPYDYFRRNSGYVRFRARLFSHLTIRQDSRDPLAHHLREPDRFAEREMPVVVRPIPGRVDRDLMSPTSLKFPLESGDADFPVLVLEFGYGRARRRAKSDNLGPFPRLFHQAILEYRANSILMEDALHSGQPSLQWIV